MSTKKSLKWIGGNLDQHAGKYRVWWSSGAWTLSYDGTRISRHASKEQAKRKAAKAVVKTTAKAQGGPAKNAPPAKVQNGTAKGAPSAKVQRAAAQSSPTKGAPSAKEAVPLVETAPKLKKSTTKAAITSYHQEGDLDLRLDTTDTARATSVVCPTCKAMVGWACNVAAYGYNVAGCHPSRERSVKAADMARIQTQTRHDVAASVVRHSAMEDPTTGPVTQLLTLAGTAGVETSLIVQPKPWPAPVEIVAFEYEHTRNSDPDPRDEEDQGIDHLILTASAELAEECNSRGIKAVLAARDTRQPSQTEVP
jgi:hypothetical protein